MNRHSKLIDGSLWTPVSLVLSVVEQRREEADEAWIDLTLGPWMHLRRSVHPLQLFAKWNCMQINTCKHIHTYVIHVLHTSVNSSPQILIAVHDPKNVEEPLPQSCLRVILPTLLRVACMDTFFPRCPDFKLLKC